MCPAEIEVRRTFPDSVILGSLVDINREAWQWEIFASRYAQSWPIGTASNIGAAWKAAVAWIQARDAVRVAGLVGGRQISE